MEETQKQSGGEKKKLHTRIRLWEFADKYVLEPLDAAADSYLSISRSDGSMASIEELPQCGSMHSPKVTTIFGVIGMLRLLVGSYLIVLTERECVGSYMGHAIFKVLSLQILPCDHTLNNSSAEQKRMESELSVLLHAAEKTSGLYFSYDVNLTLCAQRLHDFGEESKLLPLWRQADPRFMWNNYMLEALIEKKMDQYLLPVIQGSYQNFQAAVGTNIVDVTLIARRCTRRTGTRMWRRGADLDGYVANFVETEQILQSNGSTASFVQVRGSIPLLWEQIVDLTYKPSFQIVRPEDGPKVAERHFFDLGKKYGSVLAVDLINKHGSEGRLGERFANAMQPILSDNIRYVQFDFHKICGHIHFERLSLLYDQIEEYLKKHRYFLLDMKREKVEEQTGVVRTNCIDCLDRTNVTQSMIGRKMLEKQLNKIGIFYANDTIGAFPFFDASFKILWANHGDDISIQYSGTPALKGDFVRCGNRTIEGIVKDLWNASARYYLNNFADGTKQMIVNLLTVSGRGSRSSISVPHRNMLEGIVEDAIDLLQGHYIVSVSRDLALPAEQPGGLEAFASRQVLNDKKERQDTDRQFTWCASMGINMSMKLASALVLTGLVFTMISLRRARNDWRHLLLSVVWGGLTLGIGQFVRANGKIFTNRPRLLKSHH